MGNASSRLLKHFLSMAREDQAVLNEANMKKNFDGLSGKPQQQKRRKEKEFDDNKSDRPEVPYGLGRTSRSSTDTMSTRIRNRFALNG